ncbi:MAG: hypothetical protein O3B03_07660 [Proteobacteria bacterium]|nr:hypothetical protein [Pseudomonadota bacterium]
MEDRRDGIPATVEDHANLRAYIQWRQIDPNNMRQLNPPRPIVRATPARPSGPPELRVVPTSK